MFIVFQSPKYNFFRKPYGIPSTFGQEKSFLDYLFLDTKTILDSSDYLNGIDQSVVDLIFGHVVGFGLKQITDQDEITDIINNQKQSFDESNEFGLLNRLDNDTQGLLYFARDKSTYDDYKIAQSEKQYTKYYIAQVYGNPFFHTSEKNMVIDYPIMHHRFSDDRMVAIQKPSDNNKGQGKIHNVSTDIQLISYDQSQNISTLLVSIRKGIRHQIRVHLSSIGAAIIGDYMYSNNKIGELHLRSIGFK